MRSTPARLLREEQLLVDRYAVHKITKVEYPLPQNLVTVHLTNQLTGAGVHTRDLRWDQFSSTEEPFEVAMGETGKVRVELALLGDEEGHPVYRYKITDEAAGIDHEGTDLRLGASERPENTKAEETLMSLLGAAGEAYVTELEGGIDSENLDIFDDRFNEWAYQMSAEIGMAQIELSGGLER